MMSMPIEGVRFGGIFGIDLIVAFCTFLSPYAARARASIIASRISSLIAP